MLHQWGKLYFMKSTRGKKPISCVYKGCTLCWMMISGISRVVFERFVDKMYAIEITVKQ